MKTCVRDLISRIIMEPPFRIFVRYLLQKFNMPVKTRARWDLSPYPQYLLGVFTAALLAKEQGVQEISVIEFGVGGGNGLFILQEEALQVEKETGIKIKIFGFDMGEAGLPILIGDFRDHPDQWKEGDYPMDINLLKRKLKSETTLILGNLKDTIVDFFKKYDPPPIGFISIDLDLYSSTKVALELFKDPLKKMLLQVPMYFDDIGVIFNHNFAGERLAINEFNEGKNDVKIDIWYGIEDGRPFPEKSYLKKMFIAHDLKAISEFRLNRHSSTLPLAF